ncbi:uncharacterized protein LOC117105723 isoform X1 [Anneissia japonica]|uniref:uncharacterized protein LOC117105723 isoform X1 n=2 Tax=Anneissia japonica TaxID=1529436 RepID=UPI0014256AA0|nr:uncharacterized protein LOC117105723 isoform X1 [Anneissia japonica]
MILILLLHSFMIVSSDYIESQPLPRNNTCNLAIHSKALETIIRDESVLINMELTLLKSSINNLSVDVMEEIQYSDGMINIQDWVLAIGPKGFQLLSLPDTAVIFSLNTLSHGIERVSVNVFISVDCYLDADEDERQKIIASSLARFSSMDSLQKDFLICLKSNSNFESTTTFTKLFCWGTESTKNHFIKIIHILTIFGSFILLQCICLFLVSFFCEKKPSLVEGTEYINISTDLPIGPKHFVFFSGGIKTYIFVCFLCASLIYISGCVPSMIQYIIMGKADTAYIVFVIIGYFIFVFNSMLYLYIFKKNEKENSIINKYMIRLIETEIRFGIPLVSYITLNEMPNFFCYTLRLNNLKKLECLLTRLTCRLLSFEFWKQMWKSTDHGSSGCIKFIVRTFCMIIKCYIICLLHSPISIIIRSIHFFTSYYKKEGNIINIFSLLFILSSILYYVYITVILNYQLVSIISIVFFFFLGLLMNSNDVFEFVMVSFIIIGYTCITLTDYYAGYSKLLRQVIKLAVKNEPEHADYARPVIYIKNLDEGSGLTSIKKQLFDQIIKKHRPYGPEIMKTLMNLSLCCMALILVYSLKSYGQLPNITIGVRSVFYVLIPLAFQNFSKLTMNDSDLRNKAKIFKASLEMDIQQYRESGNIASNIPVQLSRMTSPTIAFRKRPIVSPNRTIASKRRNIASQRRTIGSRKRKIASLKRTIASKKRAIVSRKITITC